MFCCLPICSCLVVLGALVSLPGSKLSRGCSALCNTCVIPPVSVSNPQLVRTYRCFRAEYHVYGCFFAVRGATCVCNFYFYFSSPRQFSRKPQRQITICPRCNMLTAGLCKAAGSTKWRKA